jgi:hypothetical protein
MSFLRGWILDELDSAGDLAQIGALANQAPSIQTDVPAGFTGKSIYIPGDHGFLCKLPADQAGKTLYLWVGFKTTGDRTGFIFTLTNTLVPGAGHQVGVRHNVETQKLELCRGGNVLAIGDAVVLPNVWHILQVKLKVNSATGLCDIYLNNNPTAEISVTAANTQNQATDSILSLNFGTDGTPNPSMYIYRPIIFNGDGTKNNGKVPYNYAHQIKHLSGDGAAIWTPDTGATAYDRINNLQGAPDDDSSYVKGDALNDENIVVVESPSGVVTASALQVISRAKRASAAAAGVTFGVNINGDAQTAAERFLSSSYENYIDIYETKTGGADITAADLENLKLTSKLTTVS